MGAGEQLGQLLDERRSCQDTADTGTATTSSMPNRVAWLENSATISSNLSFDQSTRSILLTATATCRTPSSPVTARWRRVCSTTPWRASMRMSASSAVDAPVTMFRVYCTCPGVSARTYDRVGVEK